MVANRTNGQGICWGGSRGGARSEQGLFAQQYEKTHAYAIRLRLRLRLSNSNSCVFVFLTLSDSSSKGFPPRLAGGVAPRPTTTTTTTKTTYVYLKGGSERRLFCFVERSPNRAPSPLKKTSRPTMGDEQSCKSAISWCMMILIEMQLKTSSTPASQV